MLVFKIFCPNENGRKSTKKHIRISIFAMSI